MRDAGFHGIGGNGTAFITVSGCNVSYVGGCQLSPQARAGNGIEFLDNAHDDLVQQCTITQVYDSGLTNQGDSGGWTQYNITYINNIISDCACSYEYVMPGNSDAHEIFFENNTCLDAGDWLVVGHRGQIKVDIGE